MKTLAIAFAALAALVVIMPASAAAAAPLAAQPVRQPSQPQPPVDDIILRGDMTLACRTGGSGELKVRNTTPYILPAGAYVAVRAGDSRQRVRLDANLAPGSSFAVRGPATERCRAYAQF